MAENSQELERDIETEASAAGEDAQTEVITGSPEAEEFADEVLRFLPEARYGEDFVNARGRAILHFMEASSEADRETPEQFAQSLMEYYDRDKASMTKEDPGWLGHHKKSKF